MPNSQQISLDGILIEPSVIFLTWFISAGQAYDPSLYTIHYTPLYTTNTVTQTTSVTNIRLPVTENTTYSIYITSMDSYGGISVPSNSIQITTLSPANYLGLNSGLRPFNRFLSYQLNIERQCDNVEVILPYPTYIDITKKPFYQYYKIQNCFTK